jgi:hypothetical protein
LLFCSALREQISHFRLEQRRRYSLSPSLDSKAEMSDVVVIVRAECPGPVRDCRRQVSIWTESHSRTWKLTLSLKVVNQLLLSEQCETTPLPLRRAFLCSVADFRRNLLHGSV